MSKISTLPTKVTPVWADLVTWLDSEDSNIQTKNKNFLLSSIWASVFWSRTTTDIPEWTNEYYTEAKVTANTTVVSLWTDKADKSNVIEKDSTTPFTPTLPTHPVNKDYVDNFSVPDATETVKWIVEIATVAEVNAQTSDSVVMTPLKMPILPKATTTYFSQWSTSVPNWGQTFSYTSLRDWVYKVSFSISQSWAGWGGQFSLDIDGDWIWLFSTDSFGSQIVRRQIAFSAWEWTSQTYRLHIMNGETINFVFPSWIWTFTTLSSITITWN